MPDTRGPTWWLGITLITSRPLNPVYSLAPDPEGRFSDQLCTTGYYYSASRCTLNTTRLVVLYLSHAVP